MENEGTFTIRDLDEAVAAEAIDRHSAERLVEFLASHQVAAAAKPQSKPASGPDEEQFRLITGFNDIFVTIGIALFLGAIAYLAPQAAAILIDQSGQPFTPAVAANLGPMASYLIAAIAAWPLAEIFTRKRRMALPSIVLLAVFVASTGLFASMIPATFFATITALGNPETLPYLTGSTIAALAAAVHWVRFHVPITVAATAAAAAGLLLSISELIVPGALKNYPQFTFLPVGVAVFAFAMVFDTSDRQRMTPRTDMAFWLHLLAAPLIVHPIVYPLVSGEDMSNAAALQIFAIFTLLSIVALIVDRRALLVSSLAYLGVAAFQVIKLMGLSSTDGGLAVLAVGTVVLMLSVGWQNLRKLALNVVPALVRERLPPLTDGAAKPPG